MNKRVVRILKEVSSNIYKTGFLKKNFNFRIQNRLNKGIVTLSSILSVIKFLEEQDKGHYSLVLNQLKNYVLKLDIDKNLDSEKRKEQYVSVASFSSNLVDKVFLEISELLEQKKYLLAKRHINNFVLLSRGFKDKGLEKSLLKLRKEVSELERISTLGVVKHSLKELINMSDEELVNHINNILNRLNKKVEDSLVKYLAKVYLSANKNLNSLDETKQYKFSTPVAIATFKKVDSSILGVITFKEKDYDFSFNLD
ncbi:MAG: hypothetical protein ACMXX9_01555 [Candidatus Woesearchaeota archaeon]